jgi:hypothetical protein
LLRRVSWIIAGQTRGAWTVDARGVTPHRNEAGQGEMKQVKGREEGVLAVVSKTH